MKISPTEEMDWEVLLEAAIAKSCSAFSPSNDPKVEAANSASYSRVYDADMSIILATTKQRHQLHNIHMSIFVSLMRIRFAWIVFFLVVFWLVSDLVLVYASAMNALHTWELYALCGTGGGIIVGWLLHSFSVTSELYKRLGKSGANEAHHVILQRVWCHNHGIGKYLLVCGIVGFFAGCALAWKFHASRHDIFLSDSVLIALITSTTASVVGILAIVMKWMFPSDDGKESQSDEKKETGDR